MSKHFFSKRHLLVIIPILFVLIYVGTIIYGVNRPLPHEDLSYQSELKPVIEPTFLKDLAYEQDQERMFDEEIFTYIKEMIQSADDFVLFDMFLFNNLYAEEDNFPALAKEMSDELINKKQNDPHVNITVITDPVNTMYSAIFPEHLQNLTDADIPVIISDLDTLRDSNPLYSGIYRMFFQWGTLEWVGGLPNPLGSNGEDVTLHSYLTSLNGKANHRKVIISDGEGLISSGNPHDASAYHNNTAIAFKGGLVDDLLITEEAVANYSANQSITTNDPSSEPSDEESDVYGQILTESKIHERALSMINEAAEGDTIWIGLLYLSESNICDALVYAANRNVSVQIILDQNIESFGNKKIGLPNKPVAYQLLDQTDDNLQIRWYESDKEQYHPKLLFLDSDDSAQILSGSANFTRRNLEDLNLETNIYLSAEPDAEIANDIRTYFERIWSNEDGIYTADYETHKDESLWLRAIFTVQKLTKLSTF
ncbi:phospholipase D-like domain-containing protein [Alkalicoccobacillus murimartini]|uniref:Phosphatidylserine/phosphatidylglycerophosphate/ cardiolipin synthase-like enzyme n=1 Tax=Alkalicoccobacillus murimartini TaxID=171685 RepID=A0ABT9YL60_9BACI|nr:phospholipase D-like domain-containing protein [Alkalicoccobacillus murimartini]MDQ0208216.1 phosphatidylserine/phosphatidylglycerophosphate/cardiolipin synthase-like enzyme [Alkalicoccobacillus murimartini]